MYGSWVRNLYRNLENEICLLVATVDRNVCLDLLQYRVEVFEARTILSINLVENNVFVYEITVESKDANEKLGLRIPLTLIQHVVKVAFQFSQCLLSNQKRLD